MRRAGHVACMGRDERSIQGFGGGNPEGKRPLARPRRRCEDNIKMDFRKWEVGHGLDRGGSG